MSVGISKKITAKTLAGVPRTSKIKMPPGVEMLVLGIIGGSATGYKVKPGTWGDSYEIHGSFRSTNMDGSVTKAPKAYLPPPYDLVVKAGLDQMVANGEAANVRFAIEVVIVAAPNEDGKGPGYEFRVKNIIPADTVSSDPADLLFEELGLADKALPPPKMAKELPAPDVKAKSSKGKNR